MKLFRNPEIKREILYYIIVYLAGAALAFRQLGGKGAGIVLPAGAAALVLHLCFTAKRYRRIAQMSEKMDSILHDDGETLLQDCQEGELAVLHTQLSKLVLRMREQAGNLQQDKIFLADALADISHQLKTPLTSLRLLANFLNEDDLELHRRKELVREMIELLGRIEWLIYALLKMSRLDAGTSGIKKETVSVQEMLNSAYQLIAIPMDLHDIGWDCHIEPGSGYQGDLSWSTEAVSNILKNCMEHSDAGSTIHVTASENMIYTEIVISDEGEGIAKEDMPHLFERFYKGKQNPADSVGIGLSLAQKIIQEQNGTVQVKNGREKGAVFTIRFYKTIV